MTRGTGDLKRQRRPKARTEHCLFGEGRRGKSLKFFQKKYRRSFPLAKTEAMAIITGSSKVPLPERDKSSLPLLLTTVSV